MAYVSLSEHLLQGFNQGVGQGCYLKAWLIDLQSFSSSLTWLLAGLRGSLRVDQRY